MDQDWSVPGWAVIALLVVLLVLVVALAVAWTRSRVRAAAAAERAGADVAALRAQVDAIEQRLAARTTSAADPREYVITSLRDSDVQPGAEPHPPDRTPAPTVPGPLFADLVLREGVVQAASLAAGLRRALAPQARHRIRFEMRREVKRARKQRRADLRQARREYEARQRAAA